MSNVKSESNSSFLAGLAIGGLVGVAIALVFAPQKGASTRASFGNRAVSLNRTVNQPIEAADGTHESVRRTYEPPRIVLDEGTGASAPPDEG